MGAHFVYPLYYGNLADGNDIGLLYLNPPLNDVVLPQLSADTTSYEVEEGLVGVGRGHTGKHLLTSLLCDASFTGDSRVFSNVLQVANGLVPNDMGTCQNDRDAPTKMDNAALICLAGPSDQSAQGICQGTCLLQNTSYLLSR